MKKKVLVIIAVVFVVVIVVGFLIYRSFCGVFGNPVVASLPKYEKSDCYYGEGFQDYTDYCKYYFSEESNIIKSLKGNRYFKAVTADDVGEIKSYFKDFEDWVKFEDYKDKYDFCEEYIDTSDYFYIENKYTYKKYADYPDKYSAYNVYFFDVQTKTLFFIHNNI